MIKYILYFKIWLIIFFLWGCKKEEGKGAKPGMPDAFVYIIKKNESDTGRMYFKTLNNDSTLEIKSPIKGGYISSPVWSADKKRIYYIVNSETYDKNGIYSINTDTSIFRNIFKDEQKQSRNYHNLVSSTDNKFLVFSMEITRTGRKVIELFKMSPSGIGVKRITKFETMQGGMPISTESYAGSFSADQRDLYFCQSYDVDKETKQINIYRINMSSDSIQLITSFNAKDIKSTIPYINSNQSKVLVSIDNIITSIDVKTNSYTFISDLKGDEPKWNRSDDRIYFFSKGFNENLAGIYSIKANSSPLLFYNFNENIYKAEFSINF
jgi:hypothetical protein